MSWSAWLLLVGCALLVFASGCWRAPWSALKALANWLYLAAFSGFVYWNSPCIDAASEAAYAEIEKVYTRELGHYGVKGKSRQRGLHAMWRACVAHNNNQWFCFFIKLTLSNVFQQIQDHTCDLDAVFMQHVLLAANMHKRVMQALVKQPAGIWGPNDNEVLDDRRIQCLENCYTFLAAMLVPSDLKGLRRRIPEDCFAPDTSAPQRLPHCHPKVIMLACELLQMDVKLSETTYFPSAAWYLAILHAPAPQDFRQSEVFASTDSYPALNDSACMSALLTLLQNPDEQRAAVAALVFRTLVLHTLSTHPRCRPMLSHLVTMGAAKPIACALMRCCDGSLLRSSLARGPKCSSAGTQEGAPAAQHQQPTDPNRSSKPQPAPLVYKLVQHGSAEDRRMVMAGALCSTLRAAGMHDPCARWPDGLLAGFLRVLVQLMAADSGGALQQVLTVHGREGGPLCACNLPLYVRAPQAAKVLSRHPIALGGLVCCVTHPVCNEDPVCYGDSPKASVLVSAHVMQLLYKMLVSEGGHALLPKLPCDQLLSRVHIVMLRTLKAALETHASDPEHLNAPYFTALGAAARLSLFLLTSPIARPLCYNPAVLCRDSPALRQSLRTMADSPNVRTGWRVGSCLIPGVPPEPPGSEMWGTPASGHEAVADSPGTPSHSGAGTPVSSSSRSFSSCAHTQHRAGVGGGAGGSGREPGCIGAKGAAMGAQAHQMASMSEGAGSGAGASAGGAPLSHAGSDGARSARASPDCNSNSSTPSLQGDLPPNRSGSGNQGAVGSAGAESSHSPRDEPVEGSSTAATTSTTTTNNSNSSSKKSMREKSSASQSIAAECDSSGGAQGHSSTTNDAIQGSTAESHDPGGDAGGAKAPQKRQKPVKKCAACGKVDRGLKACSRCHNAHFCGPQCQRVAWPSHRLVCAPSGGVQ